MKWNISNKQRKARLVVITALVAFSTVFLLTGALLTNVYGIKPGDPGYTHYTDETGMIPNTPYQDFIVNGCLTKQHFETDKTVVMDTKGLEDLGLLFYDINTCFDIAVTLDDYTITSVEKYTLPDSSGYYEDEHMKITLTKK